MKARYAVFGGIVAAILWAVPGMAHAQPRQTPAAPKSVAKPDAAVNPQAAALADFKKRIDAYVALHRKVAGDSVPLKQTTNPAEITKAQDDLLKSLQAARADAKPGDIFTPEIRAAFRNVLRPEMKGEDGQDAKATIKDDAPATIPMKVNSKYPEGATRPTVPAKVLTNLPTLPAEVEYRIVDGHLILLDAKAWMVIDYIPNAVAQ